MTTTERFWSKVEKTDGCWEWLGSRKANGYGQFHPTRATYALAHRFAWQLLRGAIPSGLQLDHLCRNRGCVNPAHLDPVTPAENTHRSPVAQATLNAAKTHCPAGHEYTSENTHVRSGGRRFCRACGRAAWHRRTHGKAPLALQLSAVELFGAMCDVGRAEVVQ